MKMNGMKGALKRVSPCTASTSASDPAMMMKRRRVMFRVESGEWRVVRRVVMVAMMAERRRRIYKMVVMMASEATAVPSLKVREVLERCRMLLSGSVT